MRNAIFGLAVSNKSNGYVQKSFFFHANFADYFRL